MALAYLLSPTFEIVNSAGKPATGGYIETYVAGSRTKYLCASDFDGTLHPFRIPLDSLGSNVVLADDSGSYDVYVYNRYGTLLMSRYNVHPGEGGGLGGGTITSSDGSIIVTPTANGNDLKVNVGEPSVLRAGADTIYSSGPFVFSELVREGDKVWVDNSGKIRCRVGWYHYDITVRITWAPESPRNETIPVQLYTTLASNLTDFDASYTHDNTIRLSGEAKIVENGAELAFGVIGLRNGLGAELIDMGVHAICIGTAGQSDLSAGTGIVIDQGEISVDPTYMSGYATQAELTYGLAGKQDVISDLSTIRSGAQAGSTAIQPSDLATVATTGDYDDLIDKPDLSVYATTSAMNTALAGKQDVISDLAQIRAGATAGSSAVQPADLARVATTGSYDDLNNRPNLTVYATKTEVNSELATKQDIISDLSTIRSGAAAGATALQPADVATVATTGDYDDLTNKPSIPTATSDLTNDSGFITSADVPVKDVQVEGVSVVNAQGVAEISIPATGVLDVEVDGTSVVNAQGVAEITMPDLSGYATTQALNTGLATKQDTISDLATIRLGATEGATAVQPGDLATVATTGSYDDLVDKPTIPAAQVNSDWNSNSGVSQILNKPTLATVATTGDYDDLSNKPSIPAAQVNSDWNAISGVSEILNKPTIPTATSDLTNDSGFITLSDVPAQAQADWTEADSSDPSYIQNKPNLATVATTGAYSDLSGTPTINNVPAVTSSDNDKVLKASYSGGVGSYSWQTEQGLFIAIYGTSTYAEVHAAVEAGKIVYCSVSGGAGSGAGAGRMAFLAYRNPGFNYEFQYYRSNSSSSGTDSIFVYKLNSNDTWETTERTVKAGNISYPVTTVNVNGSSAMTGTVANITLPTELVPTVSSNDDGKVLKATYSGGVGSYSWQTEQGGGSTYTAGDAIDITNDEIGVLYDSDTLELKSQQQTVTRALGTWDENYGRAYAETTGDIEEILEGAPGWELTLHIPANTFYLNGTYGEDIVLRISDDPYFNYSNYCLTPLAVTYDSVENRTWIDEQDIVLHTPTQDTDYWHISSDHDARYVAFGLTSGSNFCTITSAAAGNNVTVTFTHAGGDPQLAVKNPLPASAIGDASKVLTVDNTGAPVWAAAQAPISAGTGISITNNVVSVDNTVAMKSDLPTATSDLTNDSGYITLSDVPAQVQADWNEADSSDPAYIQNKPTIPTVPTAGNMLSVTNNVLNVTTTADITDVQMVNALPASPVATVVYLIPET